MPTVTVSVDEELKAKMDRHPEINWSAVARQSFEKKVNDLELMDRLTAESELTEEDVEEISQQIDERIVERLDWNEGAGGDRYERRSLGADQ